MHGAIPRLVRLLAGKKVHKGVCTAGMEAMCCSTSYQGLLQLVCKWARTCSPHGEGDASTIKLHVGTTPTSMCPLMHHH